MKYTLQNAAVGAEALGAGGRGVMARAFCIVSSLRQWPRELVGGARWGDLGAYSPITHLWCPFSANMPWCSQTVIQVPDPPARCDPVASPESLLMQQ